MLPSTKRSSSNTVLPMSSIRKNDTMVPAIKGQEIIEEKIKNKSQKEARQYLKGRFLGKGGFAKCYEVQSLRTGNMYAAKVIDKKSLVKEKTKLKLVSEIKIHKSMNHRHIVRFERYFEDDENVYIVLEVCHCQVRFRYHFS
jgi:polo-like kinase 1